MVKKSIIFFVAIFSIWSLIMEFNSIKGKPPKAKSNIVRAENFIFDKQNVDNLIIGTSMSRKLRKNILPNSYNLSLGGQSVFDGLNILKSKKDLPQYVFIEINVLRKGANKSFTEIITSPILNTLKAHMTAFRTDRQPLLLLADHVLTPLFKSKKKKSKVKKNTDNKKKKASNQIDQYYEMRIQKREKQYVEPIRYDHMNGRFKDLTEHVNFLTSEGVKVVFFEMPVNPRLADLTKPTYIREKILADFPNYDFIPMPNDLDSYQTIDGVHLNYEEATKYSKYLREEVRNIFNKHAQKSI